MLAAEQKQNEPVLEVSDLSVMRSNVCVVKKASLKIYKGDYVGIVGPNGGGKTSLLLAILGSIPKKSGDVKLFGKPLRSFNQWNKIAYVSQSAINFDEQFPLSVRELVGLGRVNGHNLGRKLSLDDWKAVDRALEYMDITELAKKRIGELSGGQKQRVFVAKALVRDPEIIFLDEPVAGVDAVTQEKFYHKLSDLNAKSGITILIVSHDLSAVFCRMSKLVCVNRDVFTSDIIGEEIPEDILRKTYGEHFHFVFHKHECAGVFDDRTDTA